MLALAGWLAYIKTMGSEGARARCRHAEGGAGPDQLQAIIDRTAEHSPDVPPHLRGVEYSWLPGWATAEALDLV